MAYGNKANIGIIFQNSYGTAGDTGSIHFLPVLNESMKLNIPPLISENMTGRLDEGDSFEGPRTIEGEIEMEAQPIALGVLLKTVLNLDSSVQSSGIYTHNFSPRTADFDEVSAGSPVTLYAYRDTGSAMMYSDLNGNTLEIGIANGEFFMAKVGFVGGTFSQAQNVAASYSTGKRWTWDVASVYLDTGSKMPELMNMTISMEETIEAMHTLDASKYPNRLKRTGFRTISIDGTLKFDNQVEYQEFLTQSERELVIFCKGSAEVQSGYTEDLTITMPSIRYEEAAPMVEGPGQIEMSVTGKAKYNVNSGNSIKISLVNTQAAY